MQWHCVGLMGMQCDEYRVGKFVVGGVVSYELHFGHTMLIRCSSFDECKSVALKHREEKQ